MDYRAEIQKCGRIKIPSVIRKKLNMAFVDIVTIREENGDIKLITQHQALAQARSLANQYLTHDDSVDDFLRWRKEEATAEEDKMNRNRSRGVEHSPNFQNPCFARVLGDLP